MPKEAEKKKPKFKVVGKSKLKVKAKPKVKKSAPDNMLIPKAKPKIMSKKQIDILEPASKKDKFTLYLEKHNPNFYEIIKKQFFNDKTRMTKAKAFGIFKKKLVDEYNRLINKNI